MDKLDLIIEKLNSMDSDIKELKSSMGSDIKELKSSMGSDIKELKQGQINLTARLDSFEKQTMKRFNEVDSKISSVSDAVAELMEFRTDTESKLKKIK